MKIEQINPYVRYIDRRNKIKSYKDFVYAYDHRIFYVENGESVSAVTEKCGFSSTAYFIKKFREHYGTSPLKYRKERNHNLLLLC